MSVRGRDLPVRVNYEREAYGSSSKSCLSDDKTPDDMLDPFLRAGFTLEVLRDFVSAPLYLDKGYLAHRTVALRKVRA